MEQPSGRLALFFLLLSLVVFLLVFQSSYWSTGGHPTFPTDDSYIYFQYARQLVSGHPFEYNTGDAPTTGMTSILYWLFISFGYLIGFRGELIAYFALAIGFAGLFASIWIVFRIGEILVSSDTGIVAAILFSLNGQVVWGYFAGLEIPLFTTILLLSILSFLSGSDRGLSLRTMGLCALLTLTRPEGLIVGCFLAILSLAASCLMKARGERSPGRRVNWVLLPVATSIAYLLINKVVAGHISPTTASTKSMWILPDFLKILYAGSRFILDSVRGLFGAGYPSTGEVGFAGTSTVAYFVPLALFFFVFGSFSGVVRELKRREVRCFTVLVSFFVVGLGFTAFTSASGSQHHRYLIPFYPLFILCMAAGVLNLSRYLAEGQAESYLRRGILCYFLVLTLVSLVTGLCQYAFEGVMIRTTTTRAAEWVKTNLNEDDVLGIVDAGILKYSGDRQTVDLLGLTTARFYGRWMMGWGAVVEELSHMKEDERPTHMAIMPSFAAQTRGIEPVYSVIGKKIYEPWPVYSQGQNIFKTDYSLFDVGKRPKFDPEGWILVDSLDIGYAQDEKRCGYSVLFHLPGLKLDVGVHSAPYADGTEVGDGGRVILKGERFTVRTVPGRTLRIVVRSSRTFRAFRFSPVSDGYVDSRVEPFNPVTVLVNGRRMEGAGISTPTDDTWHETMLEIPSTSVGSERTTIEILGSYNSFHYWFFQD